MATNHSKGESDNDSTEEDQLKQIVYKIMAAEGVLITLANGFTLLTFVFNKQLIRRSTFSLLSVTVADFLVGIISISKYAAKLSNTYEGDVELAYKFLSQLFLSGSLFGLVLIALERMYATLLPLRHRATEARKFLIAIGLQWFAAALFSGACLIDDIYFNKKQKLKTVVPLISLVIISLCYFAIFIKVKLQHHEHQQSNQRRAQERERELARTLAVVIALSALTWMPEIIYHLLPEYNSKTLEHRIFQVFRLVNSIVNPPIYVLRMQEFRKGSRKTVKKMCCCLPSAVFPGEVSSDCAGSTLVTRTVMKDMKDSSEKLGEFSVKTELCVDNLVPLLTYGVVLNWPKESQDRKRPMIKLR